MQPVEPADRIEHQFVDSIPRDLERQRLYVSIRYRTTAHLCMCGCGNKVVHPLRPNRWSLSYDGASVSIAPSIANDGLPCNSHYWIRRDRVEWYRPLTDKQKELARSRDAGLLAPTESDGSEIIADRAGTKRHQKWRSWFQGRRHGGS